MLVDYELLENLMVVMMMMKHSKMGPSGPFIDRKVGGNHDVVVLGVNENVRSIGIEWRRRGVLSPDWHCGCKAVAFFWPEYEAGGEARSCDRPDFAPTGRFPSPFLQPVHHSTTCLAVHMQLACISRSEYPPAKSACGYVHVSLTCRPWRITSNSRQFKVASQRLPLPLNAPYLDQKSQSFFSGTTTAYICCETYTVIRIPPCAIAAVL